jgi:hypothetical protein
MSTQAQYAVTPKIGNVAISTANTNRDGTGTIGICYVAGNSGARIDRVQTVAAGTTTTNVVRYFITQGAPGPAIATITFSGTTATVTTSTAHGLSTGALVSVQGAYPIDYNVFGVAITVTSTTAFTYTMSTTPTVNATTTGYFSSTVATPVTKLFREVLITANTPSTSVGVFSNTMATNSATDIGYFPLILPPGYSLRCSTNNAETYNCFADGGDF